MSKGKRNQQKRGPHVNKYAKKSHTKKREDYLTDGSSGNYRSDEERLRKLVAEVRHVELYNSLGRRRKGPAPKLTEKERVKREIKKLPENDPRRANYNYLHGPRNYAVGREQRERTLETKLGVMSDGLSAKVGKDYSALKDAYRDK